MSKHTPGPWAIETTDDSHFILAEDSTQIASLDAVGPQSFHLPNARLIAAAPCLLVALQHAVVSLKTEWNRAATTAEQIRLAAVIGPMERAIAKATGGES